MLQENVEIDCGFGILLCEGSVWVSGSVGELLGSAVFGALELVEAVWANVDGFLAVVTVVMADEPPSDESDHECYGWNEHSDGGTGAGNVDFGRWMRTRHRAVRMIIAETRHGVGTC